MFQVNDYVIHGKYCVCKIVDICTPPFETSDNNSKYYVLKTVGVNGNTIYTPVENDRVVMRHIMTKEEAMELIHKVPILDTIEVENEKNRETHYRNMMSKGDSVELIKLIKTIVLRKEMCLTNGKKFSATDDKYLRLAEESLYGELSCTFGLSTDEVKEYFIQEVKQLEKI
jgi:CarD family transcriptional regulator